MNRLHTYTFDGQEFQLTLSVRAAKELTARHGGISETFQAISFGAENELENVIFALRLLNEQAVTYRKLIDGAILCEFPPAEELEVLMSLEDVRAARTAIAEAINLSINITVEVEQDPKNAETTQE